MDSLTAGLLPCRCCTSTCRERPTLSCLHLLRPRRVCKERQRSQDWRLQRLLPTMSSALPRRCLSLPCMRLVQGGGSPGTP